MQHLALVAILVPDNDDGIAFFVNTMGFTLLEGPGLGGEERWDLFQFA